MCINITCTSILVICDNDYTHVHVCRRVKLILSIIVVRGDTMIWCRHAASASADVFSCSGYTSKIVRNILTKLHPCIDHDWTTCRAQGGPLSHREFWSYCPLFIFVTRRPGDTMWSWATAFLVYICTSLYSKCVPCFYPVIMCINNTCTSIFMICDNWRLYTYMQRSRITFSFARLTNRT